MKISVVCALILAMVFVAVTAFADVEQTGFYREGNNVVYLEKGDSGHKNAVFLGTTFGGNGGNSGTIIKDNVVKDNFSNNLSNNKLNSGTIIKDNVVKDNFSNNKDNFNSGIINKGEGTVNYGTNAGGKIKVNPVQINEQSNEQSINIEAPKAGAGVGTMLPGQGVPELNFGAGSMKDVTLNMPKFAIYGYLPYRGETISEVLSVTANVKFKNLFKVILEDAKALADKGYKSGEVKILVFMADAQKSWTTGGNLGAGGAGAIGTGGASLGGSIVPQWGGTKADPLGTVIFVKVIP